MIAALFGALIGALLWHATVLLSRIDRAQRPRPGFALCCAVLAFVVSLFGWIGMAVSAAGLTYVGYLWWEVWKARDSRQEGPRIADRSSRHAAPIADIEFGYRDGEGNTTRRRVEVEAIDDEYFEGYCHLAGDTRTFVIGRMKGMVTDMDTGEVLPPFVWAEGARGHPGNSGVVMNRR